MLILLDEDGPVSTAQIAARIAASSSQAKQLALALQLRGLITRRDRTGLTELTSEGRQEANGLSVEVVEALQQRLSPLGTVKALEAVIA